MGVIAHFMSPESLDLIAANCTAKTAMTARAAAIIRSFDFNTMSPFIRGI